MMQGNHYCTRVYHGPGSTDEMIGYHYSYIDGSYSYKNPDGTTYYNDGRGGSRYTVRFLHSTNPSLATSWECPICFLTYRQRVDGTGWEKKEFPTAGGGSLGNTATCNHQPLNLGSAASDVMLKISECLKGGAAASVKDAIDGGMDDTNEFVMVGQDEASRSKDGNPAIKKVDIWAAVNDVDV